MSEIEKLWKEWAVLRSQKTRDTLIKAIWTAWYPKLTVYVQNALPADRESAGDAARDILLKIFDKLDRYNPEYSFSTWAYTIAANTIADIRRSAAFRAGSGAGHDPAADTEKRVLVKEEMAELEKAVKNLRAGERELIYLHYYENLRYREISEITGMPVGTVKSRIHSAREKIREALK